MTAYEIKKLWCARALMIVAATALGLYALLCAVMRPDFSTYTFDPELYKMYIERYAGRYSEQTYDELCAELEAQKQIAEQQISGSYTSDEYMFLSQQQIVANQKALALDAVRERYEQLEDRELVYDLEFQAFVNGYLKKLGVLLCLAVVTAITLKVSLGDHKCGMEGIMFSTETGRLKLIRAKLIIAMLAALAVSLLFCICDAVIVLRWDLGDTSAMLRSFIGYEKTSLDISLRSAMYLSVISRAAAHIVYSAVLFAVSRKTKNEIVSAVIAVAGFALICMI